MIRFKNLFPIPGNWVTTAVCDCSGIDRGCLYGVDDIVKLGQMVDWGPDFFNHWGGSFDLGMAGWNSRSAGARRALGLGCCLGREGSAARTHWVGGGSEARTRWIGCEVGQLLVLNGEPELNCKNNSPVGVIHPIWEIPSEALCPAFYPITKVL